MQMLRKNDEITVTVERFGGEMGIAHLEGMTLFVQGALPGETVTAEILSQHKEFSLARTVSFVTPK